MIVKQELRLKSHPVLGSYNTQHRQMTLLVDGVPVQAYDGDSIAAALWANGMSTLRHDSHTGTPRGLFCGIGHCFECRVTVDGVKDIRSCITPVQDGMQVSLLDQDLNPQGDPHGT